MPVTPLSNNTLSAFAAYSTVNQQRLSSSKHGPCLGSCNNNESKTTTVGKRTPMKFIPAIVDQAPSKKTGQFVSLATPKKNTSMEYNRAKLIELIRNTIESAAKHGQLTQATSTSITSILEKLKCNTAYAALRPNHQPQTLFHNNAQPKKSSHASKPGTNNPANDQKNQQLNN